MEAKAIEFRTEPHGEHRVRVYDPDLGIDNAIIVVTSRSDGVASFTGLELRSLWEQYQGLYSGP